MASIIFCVDGTFLNFRARGVLERRYFEDVMVGAQSSSVKNSITDRMKDMTNDIVTER